MLEQSVALWLLFDTFCSLTYMKPVNNLDLLFCYSLNVFQGIEKFQTDLSTLHPVLTECRVLKSDLELAVIQFANDISSEAHVQVTVRTGCPSP